jgi:ribosomal protein L28
MQLIHSLEKTRKYYQPITHKKELEMSEGGREAK